jgi:hypothetical protein
MRSLCIRSFVLKLSYLLIYILLVSIIGIILNTCQPQPAYAGALYLGSETKHWSPRPWYNDHHYLVGIETDDRLFLMTMVNSFDVRSYLIGRSFEITDTRYTELGFKLGLVSGYDDWYRGTGMKMMPFVALTYTVGILDFSIVPGAFSLGTKWEFK